ncbi:MAG: S-adenosyl-L-homocysteine hydrolase [Sphingomonadaceae bacterium]|nr:S-adenosyl-L-homocysteine hydrolase [Sphingomonadaceae bacterium]
MGIAKGFAAAAAVFGMLASVPASAGSIEDAEKLRRLDIMLMVTGLRCRTTPYNFQADYGRFTTKHIAALNAASRQLQSQLAARVGPDKAARALDKISTGMANTYGQGHPWLSCAELKVAARSLAQAEGPAVLAEAADQLLARSGSARFAWAR